MKSEKDEGSNRKRGEKGGKGVLSVTTREARSKKYS